MSELNDSDKSQATNESDTKLPVTKDDTLGLNEFQALDLIIRPYFEGHWKNQLEKTKLDNDYDLIVMKTESKYRGWVAAGIFLVIFSVIALAFYLFQTGKDEYAMKIIVGIVLLVTSSLAGYGWKASRNSKIQDIE